MSGKPSNPEVFIEASARLHFGVLDLRGDLGRWFGGIGAAAPSPTLRISACTADNVSVTGDDSGRIEGVAHRVLSHFGVRRGVRLTVHRSLPAHVGLGSGTQLALAVARAIAELNGITAAVGELSTALGRGERSAVGTYTFEAGGLVVEGGRREGASQLAPLVARLPFPPSWWCVVGIPDAPPGVNGAEERAAFADLPPPSEAEVSRVAHLVMMALLPALADSDLGAFGRTLNTIQSITGGWFAPAQGGTFAPGPTEALVRSMADWGALGVGQSSWGPAVYGIVDGEDAGRRLGDRVRKALGSSGRVYDGPFPTDSVRLWREPVLELDRPPVPSADLG